VKGETDCDETDLDDCIRSRVDGFLPIFAFSRSDIRTRDFDNFFFRSVTFYVNAEPKVLCTTYLIPLEARIQIT